MEKNTVSTCVRIKARCSSSLGVCALLSTPSWRRVNLAWSRLFTWSDGLFLCDPEFISNNSMQVALAGGWPSQSSAYLKSMGNWIQPVEHTVKSQGWWACLKYPYLDDKKQVPGAHWPATLATGKLQVNESLSLKKEGAIKPKEHHPRFLSHTHAYTHTHTHLTQNKLQKCEKRTRVNN